MSRSWFWRSDLGVWFWVSARCAAWFLILVFMFKGVVSEVYIYIVNSLGWLLCLTCLYPYLFLYHIQELISVDPMELCNVLDQQKRYYVKFEVPTK